MSTIEVTHTQKHCNERKQLLNPAGQGVRGGPGIHGFCPETQMEDYAVSAGATSHAPRPRTHPRVYRNHMLASIPAEHRDLYRKAWARKDRKAAIRACCLQCGWWMPGNVADCKFSTCPLYEYRVYG